MNEFRKLYSFTVDGIEYNYCDGALHVHTRKMIEVKDDWDAGATAHMPLSRMDDPFCDKCWVQGKVVQHPASCKGYYHYRDSGKDIMG